jgi:hypothetical protein
MPKVTLSGHARLRMQKRRISRQDVEQCVLNPSSRYQTRGKNHYRRTVNGRRLRIVVAPDRDNEVEKFVVTVIDEDLEENGASSS